MFNNKSLTIGPCMKIAATPCFFSSFLGFSSFIVHDVMIEYMKKDDYGIASDEFDGR